MHKTDEYAKTIDRATSLLVSVVVPVYNMEARLRKCIDSILSQTYPHFELILIDDGSTDSSPNICHKYANSDCRIKSLFQQNRGPSTARNLGLSVAHGDLVAFVDSDDWVEQTYIESLIDGIKDADLVLVGATWENSSLSKRFSLDCAYFTQRTEVVNAMCSIYLKQYGSLWNKIFRRAIIEKNKIRFDELVTLGEDSLFVTQYLCHVERLRVLDCTPYHYLFLEGEHFSRKLIRPETICDQLGKHSCAFETLYDISEASALPSVASSFFYNGLFYHFLVPLAKRHALIFSPPEVANEIIFRDSRTISIRRTKGVSRVYFLMVKERLHTLAKLFFSAYMYYRAFRILLIMGKRNRARSINK